MFIKMRESKGFTLVELMIVVAIIGILAAVAVPFYQRYIQKARLTSLVMPGIHVIETSLATYYSVQSSFPATIASAGSPFLADANTKCFGTPTYTYNGTNSITLTFQVGNAANGTCPSLALLSGAKTGIITVTPQTMAGKITGWALSGSLATNLGLGN